MMGQERKRTRHNLFWTLLVMLGASGAGPLTGCSKSVRKPATPAPVRAPRAAYLPSMIFETARGDLQVKVEVAANQEARVKGLQHRRKLEEGRGMLFIFPRQEIQSFWMKNTHIALDMIFIDRSLTVVGIVENAEPMTLTPRVVKAPSLLVLEVPAYFSRQVGIIKGVKVRLDAALYHLLPPK